MSILRVTKRDNPFVQIEKAAIEDSRLSWRAKGLLVYFLSKPDNWTIRMGHIVKQSVGEGRDAVRTAMNELRDAGYASLKNTNKGSEWNIIEHPMTKPCPENPQEPPPEKPSTVFADSVQSAASNNDSVRKNERKDIVSDKPKLNSVKAPDGTVSSHTLFIKLWTESYATELGTVYAFQSGKDGKAVKTLLEQTKKTPEELVEIAKSAWRKTDGFWSKMAVSITGFNSKFNEISAEVRKSQPKKDSKYEWQSKH